MNRTVTAEARHQQVAVLIDSMELEMRRLDLWSEVVPAVADLASRVPFCYDTLQFCQWLQWIFVPRIRLILADHAALPDVSDIASLAEVEFRQLSQDSSRLLEQIREFDQLISNQH